MVSVCLCVSQRGVTVGKRLLQPQGYVTTSTYMLSVYITPLWMCVFQISATALSVSVSKRKEKDWIVSDCIHSSNVYSV